MKKMKILDGVGYFGSRVVLIAGLAFCCAHAMAAYEACGSLENTFGPFDYRVRTGKLSEFGDAHRMVEGAHFTPMVEALIKGKTALEPGPDIDYTLRAFPNHHRALLAMMNLSFREKTAQPQGARYTIECYFERAERFRPDDEVVKMLVGVYLLKTGRSEEAIKKLEEAQKKGQEDANLYYNLGLAYAQLKQYDKALTNAQRAYAMGFPLPGLRNILERAGKWRAPDPSVAAPEQAVIEQPVAEPVPTQNTAAQTEEVKLEADGAVIAESVPASENAADETPAEPPAASAPQP